jgi:hypothetical protein
VPILAKFACEAFMIEFGKKLLVEILKKVKNIRGK